MQSSVLSLRPEGLYCPEGDFYIDPWRPVARAVITHGHADHARPGHGSYLATSLAAPMLFHRLGSIRLDTVDYGEMLRIGDVTLSCHPAGHIPGSAQICIVSKSGTWVVSGDYKLEEDGVSTAFEPVNCDTFISECTFGLPVFTWAPQKQVMEEINSWWSQSASEGRIAMIGAYSLGKAQRILAGLDLSIGPILTHGAIEGSNAVLRAQGIALPPTEQVTKTVSAKTHPGALVIAPPSALHSAWAKRFGPVATAIASGWMGLRGVRRRRAVDRGFVLSDHADWAGLNGAIAATGAERVLVTHGYTDIFAKWLGTQGYDATSLETEFNGEEDAPEQAAARE